MLFATILIVALGASVARSQAAPSAESSVQWPSYGGDVLPAGGNATPMTYSSDGKQYLVIAAGGQGKLDKKLGDSVVAYSFAVVQSRTCRLIR